ncbi:MAG: PQQ-binding-like beta-propeller repeat protein [Verrucomicrobiota bacterium]
MHSRSLIRCLSVGFLFITFAAHAANWPRFRGPDGLGIADGPRPPVEFGPAKNVLWKVPLPGGHSSPVIWGDRIFLTAFENGQLSTLCLDRKDGKILWTREAPAKEVEKTHRTGSPAAPTPVTDGERVYVYFGSFGLVAYDFTGKEVWNKSLPVPITEFGAGTSPVLAGDFVLLQCDQDLGSFLLALDRYSGRQVWKAERSEFRRAFTTPLVWRHAGGEEVVVPGSLALTSYNLKDGKLLWTVRGMARVANASPVAGDGLLFVSSWTPGQEPGAIIEMPRFKDYAPANDKNEDGKITLDEVPNSALRGRFGQIDLDKDGIATPEEWDGMADMFVQAEHALFAVKPGGRGDITKSHVAWKQSRALPYVSSPLFYQGRVFTVKSGGLASCYDAKSGKIHYQDERLGALGDYYASAVAAGGVIYIASQQGMVVVLESADTLNVLARNAMGEKIYATPAIVDGKIYLRTEKQLYCLGN